MIVRCNRNDKKWCIETCSHRAVHEKQESCTGGMFATAATI